MTETKTASPPGTVTFTLDGRRLSVPQGTTVLLAALRHGVYIPHYCYAPTLSIPASCRLCLVEVERMPKLAPSCMLPVAEGMVVRTDTETVRAARRDMMQFLLANHPLDCPVCDKGGECQLQRYAMDYGVEHSTFHDTKRRFKKPEFDPLLDIERNRCILCTRCVRFDAEVCDNHKIAIFSRGSRNYIGTWGDEPIGSIFSGNNIDLCPVGCWTAKPFRFQARVWELTRFQGTCTYCSAGCNLTYWARDGHVYRATPAPLPPETAWDHDAVGHRYICDVGRFCSDFRDSEERLVRPQLRSEDQLRPTDWAAALTAVVRGVKDIITDHGASAVGVLAGSRLACEDLAAVERFARVVLKTPNIDWRTGLVCHEGAVAHSAAFAMADGDLEQVESYDAVLVAGAHLTEAAPIVSLRVKDAARTGKIRLFTLAGRPDTWLERSATASLHVAPGHTGTLLKGVLRLLAGAVTVPAGLEEEVRRVVSAYPLERVSADCGVSEAEIKSFAQGLLRAPRLLILHDPSDMGGIGAADTVGPIGYFKALVSALDPAKNAWHSLPVTPARNGLAACWLGCQPDRLPDGTAPPATGLSAPEMMAAIADGSLRALIVFGAGDFVGHPEAKLLARAISGLDLLVVVDTFPGKVSARAHVVLPAASPLECKVTFGDAFRRLVRMEPVAPPPGEARGIGEIVERLAERMGVALVASGRPSPGVEGLRRLDPAGQGRLAVPGEQADAFRRLRGSRAPAPEQGTVLLWGVSPYGRDHDGNRSAVMPHLRPAPTVYLHAAEAQRLGVAEGERVDLVLEGEILTLPVAVRDDVPRGAAFVYRNCVDLPLGDLAQTYPTVELRRSGNGAAAEAAGESAP